MISAWLKRLLNRPSPSRALILMYHRVDRLACDPWQLTVTPDHFEEQLSVLCRDWHPISLTQLSQDIASQRVVDKSVAITFDDGYIDNFTQAKPLLEKYSVPATFFIATRHTESQASFWWDELQTLLVQAPVLPEQLRMPIADELITVDLSRETILTPELEEKQKTWVACVNTPTSRCRAYEQIWQRLKPMSAEEQQVHMDYLRNWAGAEAVFGTTEKPLCMTLNQLHELKANPLFTVGSHTMNHPALGERPAGEQQTEIEGGNEYLRKVLGEPVQVFAYPYGNYNETSVSIVQSLGLSAAVTTEEGLLSQESNCLRLNRYQVCDWNGAAFTPRLNTWYSSRSTGFNT